jgi:N-acetylmuramoyl-L-alanine amidase
MPFTHVVKPGDCLFRIAKQYEFSDWKPIYNHPENAAFRQRRPDPNVIFPGDRIVIPDKEPRDEPAATGARHRFKVKPLRTMLRVVVKNEADEPLAGKRFELKLGGETYEGSTDGDGVVEQRVPEGDEIGELTVYLHEDDEGERYHWDVRVGHLDPIAEVQGVQQRLNNLGFYCGEADGRTDERLRLALRGFQDIAGLEKTGEIDDATRAKLVEMHGGV